MVFIAVTPLPYNDLIHTIELVLGLFIVLDFFARFWLAKDRMQHAKRIYVIADAAVIFAILFNPLLAVDLSFLRILRGLWRGHSDQLLQDLRRDSTLFRYRDDAVVAGVNLFAFIFATLSAVFSFFARPISSYEGFVDAIYFTVTMLTTTGYGDIVPDSALGKIVAICIMIVGVSLFVQLARTVVALSKVKAPCNSCG